jgi:hypothetical protein
MNSGRTLLLKLLKERFAEMTDKCVLFQPILIRKPFSVIPAQAQPEAGTFMLPYRGI